jgi:LmbE family N-acetylglucosaminyl deacetylase
MKYLIVAHPDDECLWFAPEKYDKIVIVFTDRSDRPGFGDNRRKAIAEHPLKDKIECLDLTESNFWRDNTKFQEQKDNYDDICEYLRGIDAESIDTHNANGEYGHADHILVRNAVLDTVNCPVNGQDPKLYRDIKKVYQKYNAWTWT